MMSNNKEFNPTFRFKSKPCIGRIHILARLIRFAVRSLRSGYYDFAINAMCSVLELVHFTVNDVLCGKNNVKCNICGWSGISFYHHTGPGFYERFVLCPGCLTLDRHRSLLLLLKEGTDLFTPGKRVIEVAPERSMEELYLSCNGLDYTSFDITRHAMEHGDITHMQYLSNSVDFFLCFHVLEHVQDERRALSEIQRILKPSGCAIVQVPIDWDLKRTYEYPEPNPRESYHVRRYGADFEQRVTDFGFKVTQVRVNDYLSKSEIAYLKLSEEPIFFLRK